MVEFNYNPSERLANRKRMLKALKRVKRTILIMILLASQYYGAKFFWLSGYYDGIEMMMKHDCEQFYIENDGKGSCSYSVPDFKETVKDTFLTFP